MKVLGLCFLFVVCLAPLAQAQESSKSTNDQAVIAAPAAGDNMILDLNAKAAPGSDTSCAFMRTYRVKRDHPGSDMTRPAGYTACVPFKRFEVKSAVQVQSEPASANTQH
jgi:hypothetical protein